MNAHPVLLQKKYARVVDLLADTEGLSREDALDFFYHSQIYPLLREGVSDLHCRSDAYLVNILQEEVSVQRGRKPPQVRMYHGSRETVLHPAVQAQRYQRDFGPGFYCVESPSQARRMAARFGEGGIVNGYRYTEAPELTVKHFPEVSEAWLDFVMNCRSGVPHGFHIVKGPMADDTVFDAIQRCLDGEISREACWELVRDKRPGYQVCFCSEKALHTLAWEGGYPCDEYPL